MDTWDAGELYERYMGRWSRRLAPPFLAWLDAAPGARWLDVGCGTGALASAVLDACHPALVVGIDPSEAFVAAARHGIPSATFEVGDAELLPYRDRSFDVCVSAIALNFVPDPARALAEMRRVTATGGRIAAYVWDYAGGMELLRAFWDAAVALDPAAAELDEARRFPLCAPGALASAFRDAGLVEVEGHALRMETGFASFDEYWAPFLGGQGPAPSYVAGLPPARRADLEARLRERIVARAGGEIVMTATAWAAQGRVPA
ncbi:class I SAM-dependent methyltransferase [Demequina gelatinilytica]|uniref:class I SAM-dependent methyltransferase n=1 Tax=Demequina gelatinilytica TaxID=1638980 RepID=UPI000AFAE73E|nr:methyltransferase domain-containing protein [Demequina gelatinilytica]